MKLHISDNKEIKGNLEVDYYTPICIRFDENDRRPRELLIYRIINPKSSLIEFSINNNTKKLVNITFVSINGIEISNTSIEFDNFNQIGNPDFDISIFGKEKIITREINFNTTIFNDQLVVLLTNENNMVKVISMEYIDFLVNEEDKLIGFRFRDFSKEQWNELKEAIQHALNSINN